MYLATSITTLKKKTKPSHRHPCSEQKKKRICSKTNWFFIMERAQIIQNIVLLFTIIIATKNCHHSVNTSSILPKPFGKVAKIIRYTHNRFKKSFGSIPKKFSYLTYQRLLYHTNCSRIAKMVPSSPLLRQIIEIKQDRNVSFSTKKSYLALCDILLFCHFWYFFSYT